MQNCTMVCIHFHFFQHLLSRPLTFARLTRVCLISDHSKNIDLVFKHSQERQQVLHAGDNKICCVIVQGIPGYEVKATQQITTREKSTSQTGDTTEFANKPTHKCGKPSCTFFRLYGYDWWCSWFWMRSCLLWVTRLHAASILRVTRLHTASILQVTRLQTASILRVTRSQTASQFTTVARSCRRTSNTRRSSYSF